jgi:ribonuclease D
VRDSAAARLELDPGVLCSRDRLETVARKQPKALEQFEEIPEMRRWQVEVLGPDFLRALHPGRPVANNDSPYRDAP